MKKKKWLTLIVPALSTVAIFYLITGDYSPSERIVVLRYMLFAWSGVVALILPHLSFPHDRSGFLQLLNESPVKLFKTYILSHRSFLMVSVAAVTGISFSSYSLHPGLLVTGVLFILGLYLVAANGYLTVGATSQAWKEGAGTSDSSDYWYNTLAQNQIQPGAFPSLWMSIKIAVTGMAWCVAGAVLYSHIGPGGDLAAATLLFAAGVGLTVTRRSTTDRHFYRTNAFFSEFFRSGQSGGSEREPLKVRQLWWIPLRWRVHSWAMMLQQERSLPAGRMIATGHALLWIIAWFEPDPATYYLFWALFALGHHALLFISVRSDLLPAWWALHLDSAVHWAMAGLWSQIRWLLPLMAGSSGINLLFGMFEWSSIGWLGAGYLLSAALLSIVAGLKMDRPWAT